MAKKAMIERERKRQRLVAKFQEKRAALREAFKTTESFEEKLALQQQLQKLPRNSSRVRLNVAVMFRDVQKRFTVILDYPVTFSVNLHTKGFFLEFEKQVGNRSTPSLY